jgi:AcrR family transcriptional regulator
MNAERGRPRSFDIDTVLDQATEVFWRQGFQGASLADLTAATGLSKPSLYAAFGDKEALYLRCLQRYADRAIEQTNEMLEREPDARRAVEGLMRATVDLQCAAGQPGGCLIVTGSADCGHPSLPATIEQALRKASGATRQRIEQRLLKAECAGELPPGTDAKRLAALFGAVLAGMAVMAKAGQPRQRLEEAVDAAMMVWPEKTEARLKAH